MKKSAAVVTVIGMVGFVFILGIFTGSALGKTGVTVFAQEPNRLQLHARIEISEGATIVALCDTGNGVMVYSGHSKYGHNDIPSVSSVPNACKVTPEKTR